MCERSKKIVKERKASFQICDFYDIVEVQQKERRKDKPEDQNSEPVQ